MESSVKTYSFPNGQIQRVQLVRLPNWESLRFLSPEPWDGALDCFSDIYRKYLVPACPWIFGNMILFQLPEELPALPMDTGKYGTVAEPLTAAAAALRQGVKLVRGKPVFKNDRARALWTLLEKRGCIRTVSGKLPVTTVIPVSHRAGLLSGSKTDAALKVNASFFIMDRFDCATVYDQLGTPFGLCVKDGNVLYPPLYGREALLVKKDGSVAVEPLDIHKLGIQIGDRCYRSGENAAIYTRPERAKTPRSKGKKLVIIGKRVAAVCTGSRADIPASGFVLRPEGQCDAKPGDEVTYRGLEDVTFGIQVGNSILRDGKKTERFISRFYNIRKLEKTPFPPSLYPMDFHNSRAARIALGADAAGKPMLLWAEGAGKNGYTPGKDSRGASLSDMAEFCSDLGMVNAVNLDGGGSAQILLKNSRSLLISDRDATTGAEAERPVPLALTVE